MEACIDYPVCASSEERFATAFVLQGEGRRSLIRKQVSLVVHPSYGYDGEELEAVEVLVRPQPEKPRAIVVDAKHPHLVGGICFRDRNNELMPFFERLWAGKSFRYYRQIRRDVFKTALLEQAGEPAFSDIEQTNEHYRRIMRISSRT